MTTDYTQPRLTLEDMRAKLMQQTAELDAAHQALDALQIPAGTLPERIATLQARGLFNYAFKWKQRAMVTAGQLRELDERYCALAEMHGWKRTPRRKAA